MTIYTIKVEILQLMNKNEKEYCKYIGQKIRMIRTLRLKNTLRQFALECEVPASTLSRIENSVREPGFITMKKISEGFGIPYCDFIKELEQDIPEKFSIYEE